MKGRTTLSRWIAGALGLAVLSIPATILQANEVAAQLEAIRAATERFKDVNVALEEGYIPDPSGHCVSAEAEGLPEGLGGMGIHYLRPDLLGITATKPRVDENSVHIDFENPSILLYESQADGSLVLVGVENLVFESAWKAAGNTELLVFAGRTWDHMEDDPTTR